MKKTLAILLAMALLCIMAVGTTLTYFTDEDSDVNTMTVGKVGITQNETDRTGVAINSGALKLYPVTALPNQQTGLVAVENNGVDKFVSVMLDDNSADDYVRTIFAFEKKADGTRPINNEVKLVGGELINMTGVTITVDGVHYTLGVCTYDAPLTSTNKTSDYSLKQVYLDSQVNNEFSDAIGGSYEILVLSQAVQTQGFTGTAEKSAAQVALDTAFCAITPENAGEIAGWFNN